MSSAAGIILATGGITIANDIVFQAQPMNWKIPIATGIGALIFGAAQSAVGKPAVLLAWLVLVSSLLYTPKGGKSFSTNLAAWVNPPKGK